MQEYDEACAFAPNGKRYFETTHGLLRVDSTTGHVWRYFPHQSMPLTDSTLHCTDTTEVGFTYLAADSGDTFMMCDLGRVWGLNFASAPSQVGALHTSRRQMIWHTLDRIRVFADSIGLCRQTYSKLYMDYFVWELSRATVHGSTFFPVELRSFSAEKTGTSVLLRWSTAQEVDNMGFEVQRCTGDDVGEWEAVGFVPASTGRSGAEYRFEDCRLPAAGGITRLQYRLRQLDCSGENWYSPVQSVNISTATTASLKMDISPMPVRTAATMTASGVGADAWVYSVFDLHGRRIAHVRIERSTGNAITGRVILQGQRAGTYLLVAEHGASRLAQPFIFIP